MGITKLSACLPTYNGELFVAEAIRSILRQTFEDVELIVVDDCSDDNGGRPGPWPKATPISKVSAHG